MFLFLSVILMLNQYGKIIIKIDEFYTINLHLHRLKKNVLFINNFVINGTLLFRYQYKIDQRI